MTLKSVGPALPSDLPAWPEPFFTAVRDGRPRDVCDADAPTALALYARAHARLQVSRDDEARRDLEAAVPEMGDVAAVEIAFVDIRQRATVKRALEASEQILSRSPAASFVRARALHAKGLALGKLRRVRASTAALLDAVTVHRAIGNRAGQAQVYDTLGTLYASSGQLEAAVGYYALSIVEKILGGDRYGTAITLGNLGRLHLRAGRFRQALECFEEDLRIAESLGDEGGRCRMLEDMGRAHLGLEDLDSAERQLREAIDLATTLRNPLLEFFARKDLALTLLSRFRREPSRRDLLDDAAAAVDAAGALLQGGEEPYLEFVRIAVRGEILAAKGEPAGLGDLERAARSFAESDLPDFEIPTLIALARTLAASRYRRSAEQCLVRAMSRARRDGYARYMPVVREEMKALELVESAVEETGCLDLGVQVQGSSSGYTLLELVGQGGFASVYRAIRVATGDLVAIKVLRDEALYEPSDRRRRLASMRLEIEAASRIRHPGIARVFAIGTDSDGATYVVQEFVEGRTLRREMPADASAEPWKVLATIEAIANALSELHACGIVHRDVKPENVIVRKETNLPVLVDFGIAYVPSRPDEPGERSFVGTLLYMSPEQAAGKLVDGRSDVYSLGVVLYEWLTGHRPIEIVASSLEEARREILASRPVPIGRFRSSLSPAIVELVTDMLARNPRRRPNAAAVARRCATCFGRELASVDPDGSTR
jgi:tRNA A-37 threonylcarbamoyl transferase component Bud32/tetratricopeptide (TPR) repeat protein